MKCQANHCEIPSYVWSHVWLRVRSRNAFGWTLRSRRELEKAEQTCQLRQAKPDGAKRSPKEVSRATLCPKKSVREDKRGQGRNLSSSPRGHRLIYPFFVTGSVTKQSKSSKPSPWVPLGLSIHPGPYRRRAMVRDLKIVSYLYIYIYIYIYICMYIFPADQTTQLRQIPFAPA